MKKQMKAMGNIAIGGLTLGALAGAETSMGAATPLVGKLTTGIAPMMPAVGSMLGAGMVIESTKMLHPHWKNWKKRK